MFKPFENQYIYITSETIDIKDKYECRKYLKDMEKCNFNDFDTMIDAMNSFRVIALNQEEWQNSLKYKLIFSGIYSL